MMIRTRYFVIASLLVLLVGIGTGLVAYYVGRPIGERHGAFQELQFMPRDAAVIAYADVRQVMTSELRQRVRRALPLPQQNGQRAFEDRTGINIETDIDRVMACFESGRDGAEPGSPLVLARGRFNEVKIEASMRDRGGDVEAYKGKRLIVAAGPRDHSLAVAFIQPGFVAVGEPWLVRSAIDLQGGGDSVVNNPELMKLVDSLDNANAWAVGRFDAFRSSARLPPAVVEKLPAITWFSVSGHVDGGVDAVVRAETRDEEAGNNLRDVVRGFVALAKMQAASSAPLQTMVQSFELGGSGKTVALSFSVPGDVFDALGVLQQRRNPPGH